MNAAEAMEQIESHRFSAVVNLASDFPTFLRILACQPEVVALAEQMGSDQTAYRVFIRVLELADSSAEDEYEHPADAALAAYMWLLSAKGHESCEIAAETLLGCKRCWWARKMAQQVRKATIFRPRSRSASSVRPTAGWQVDFKEHGHSDVALIQTFAQISDPAGPCGESPPSVFVYPAESVNGSDVFKSTRTNSKVQEVLVEVKQ